MSSEVMEVKGYKMEVTGTQATLNHRFKIGERVSVLIKEYSDTKIYDGIIVAFYPFQELPSIHVCYLEGGYSAGLKFAVINEKSEGKEIVPAPSGTFVVDKMSVLTALERQRNEKLKEIEELDAKKNYFLAHFNKYFSLENTHG